MTKILKKSYIIIIQFKFRYVFIFFTRVLLINQYKTLFQKSINSQGVGNFVNFLKSLVNSNFQKEFFEKIIGLWKILKFCETDELLEHNKFVMTQVISVAKS